MAGLPQINIIYQTQAKQTAKAVQRGVMAVIIRDDAVLASDPQKKVDALLELYKAFEIPDVLTAENQAYLESAFVGNVTAPVKVYVAVIPISAEDYSTAFASLARKPFDWLCGAPNMTQTEREACVQFIEEYRNAYSKKYKGVFAVSAEEDSADSPYIVNVVDGINGQSAASLCARIAGMICGTPLTQSLTYAVLPEAKTCTPHTAAEGDALADAGKITLVDDGEKVKIGREVNSLTTLRGAFNNEKWKSIKIVETADIIKADLKKLYEDTYVGKGSNNYDYKMLLVSATKAYLEIMEAERIIQSGSTVDIDVEATEKYLKENGTYRPGMSDEEIKQADTGTHVFMKAAITMLRAAEDITLRVEA